MDDSKQRIEALKEEAEKMMDDDEGGEDEESENARKLLLFSSVLVVWNPLDKKAKLIPNLGDEEYKHMLCVEALAIIGLIITYHWAKLTTEGRIIQLTTEAEAEAAPSDASFQAATSRTSTYLWEG
ncbi:uncharacterized protein LOC130764634 [Actinidia eriantha]|uniref:uncharacterized protein LOC130764634 n=1 Tax=Actinidia eriantha TaxID=165200 RepID=UPI00258BE96B|nr:uncharacterized protein LOC130764634 [Actinidia eriantha]